MLYILFGLPGSGKTYIGKIFEKYYGYHFYEGDLDIPMDMKQNLLQEQSITDNMRNSFFTKLINSTHQLQATHTNLVIAQTFIKEKYRQQLLTEMPYAKFVLVRVDNSVRKQRLLHRHDYPLKYLMNMETYFDKPEIQHTVITNNEPGEKKIKNQVETLLKNET